MSAYSRFTNFPPGLRRLPGDRFTHPARESFWPDLGAMAMLGSVLGVLGGLTFAMFADTFAGGLGPDSGPGLRPADRLVLYPTCVVAGASLGATTLFLLGAVTIALTEGAIWLCRLFLRH